MTDSKILSRFGKLPPNTDFRINHFRDWAESKGYSYCEVLDWESNTGDWTFIISRDGSVWQVMTQYKSRDGFLRGINRKQYFGNPGNVIKELR